ESSCPESVPDHLLDCAFNDVVFTRRVFNGKTSTQGAAQTYDTTGVILRRLGNHLDLSVPNFTFGCPSRRDQTGLAWYELYYERLLQPADDAIEFRTHRGAGDFRYDIGPFVHTPPSFVFDVTDPTRPVRLTGALASGAAGAFTLSMADTQTVSHRYAVVPDSVLHDNAALQPAAARADAPFTSKENLRSSTQHADYLVIYFDGFKAAADTLVAWRTSRLPLITTPAPHIGRAIPISALYDQFSGGRTDPGAIRNFLRAAAGCARRPLYV